MKQAKVMHVITANHSDRDKFVMDFAEECGFKVSIPDPDAQTYFDRQQACLQAATRILILGEPHLRHVRLLKVRADARKKPALILADKKATNVPAATWGGFWGVDPTLTFIATGLTPFKDGELQETKSLLEIMFKVMEHHAAVAYDKVSGNKTERQAPVALLGRRDGFVRATHSTP